MILYVADFSGVVLSGTILESFAVKPQPAEDSHTFCVTDAAHSFIRNLRPDDSGDATDVLVRCRFAQLELYPSLPTAVNSSTAEVFESELPDAVRTHKPLEGLVMNCSHIIEILMVYIAECRRFPHGIPLLFFFSKLQSLFAIVVRQDVLQ